MNLASQLPMKRDYATISRPFLKGGPESSMLPENVALCRVLPFPTWNAGQLSGNENIVPLDEDVLQCLHFTEDSKLW